MTTIKDGRWQHCGYRAANRVSVRVRDVSAPPEPRPMLRMALAGESLPVEPGELTVAAAVDVELALEQG